MESEVAGLRDFLGSEWLQDDTLDACDRLLQEASDVYEASRRGRRRPALDRNTDITHLSMIVVIVVIFTRQLMNLTSKWHKMLLKSCT